MSTRSLRTFEPQSRPAEQDSIDTGRVSRSRGRQSLSVIQLKGFEANVFAFQEKTVGFHDFHDVAILSLLQGPLRLYDSCELAVSGIPIQAFSQ